MASISSRSRGVAINDLRRILSRPEIVGLGESYWQALLQDPAEMTAALEETLKTGKPLEGHSAGASERKLNAYLAAGITSCHEPIRAEEVLQRLRLGLHVMVREGSIRRDLKEIAQINASQAELRRLVLVTDGLSPQDLVEKGCMEFVVQKAIDSGFGPITAIQMATLNVAEHFGLDGLIGGIAPGRLADMLLVPDMGQIQAQTVISDGRLIARNGQLMVPPRYHQFSDACMNTVRLPRPLSASDFRIPIASDRPGVTVRAIELVTDLVTSESHIDLPVQNGELTADADQDLLKIAAIDRARDDGRMFVGIIKGFGLRQGALACSTSWDSADVIVAGANDSDMALAVNRIRETQGCAVVCNHGKSLAEISLPILGIMSDLPLAETLEQLTRFNHALSKLGVTLPDPLLTLSTLTGAAIPYLRICEEGLVNLKHGKTMGLLVTD
jgi:adenine deaminase